MTKWGTTIACRHCQKMLLVPFMVQKQRHKHRMKVIPRQLRTYHPLINLRNDDDIHYFVDSIIIILNHFNSIFCFEYKMFSLCPLLGIQGCRCCCWCCCPVATATGVVDVVGNKDIARIKSKNWVCQKTVFSGAAVPAGNHDKRLEKSNPANDSWHGWCCGEQKAAAVEIWSTTCHLPLHPLAAS